MKQFIVSFLSVVALLICCAVFSQQTNAATYGSFTYLADRGEVTLMTCDSSVQGEVVIPETIDGYKVTSLGDSLFSNCTGITSVVIPDSVKVIGYYAFENCYNLTEVNFPNGLETIGFSAFYGCRSLASVTLNNNITSIGNYAFAGCSALTSIVIPSSITRIGPGTFKNCTQLFAVEIGANITSVGKDAFGSDGNIFYVYYTGTQQQWTQINFETGNTALTDVPLLYFSSQMPNPPVPPLPEDPVFNCTLINGNAVITGLKEPLAGDVVIPDVLRGCVVAGIDEYAFFDCQEITSVSIPDTVIFLGTNAFRSCSNLAEVDLPDNLEFIGNSAFSGCSKLTSITLGSKVRSIGSNAFSGCSALTSVVIPDNVQELGTTAFYRCYGLTDVSIGTGITAIENSAFAYCTSLQTILIPDNIQRIGGSAFFECGQLFAVELGAGLNFVETNAFAYTDDLFYVYYSGTEQQWAQINFESGNTTLTDAIIEFSAKMPDTPVAPPTPEDTIFYYTLKNGKAIITGSREPLVGDVVIPASLRGCPVTEISGMSLNTRMTSITIPDSVQIISDYAFQSCHELSEIIGGKNVTTIGAMAFFDCRYITAVTISETVTSIGEHAFGNCYQLTEFCVSENNPVYSNDDRGVLYNKDKTVLIQVPLKVAGQYIIPDSVTAVSDFGLDGCRGLTKVTVGTNVTYIGINAFAYCDGLTAIALPSGLRQIGDDAFSYCTALTDVYYAGTQTQWEQLIIGENNTLLTGATIHFLSEMPAFTGDLDHSGSVDEDDAIYLLRAVLTPSLFPADLSADLNHNGRLDEDDAIYLLRHVLMPEQFPI